jgi:hypothetical protein|tara:strand:+ start:337 stop:798 length:462 start_codon:yes stop_codon:yes gene_type:complete
VYRTEDNYEFSFSNEVSQLGITELEKICENYSIQTGRANSGATIDPTEFREGETDLSFILNSTYSEFKKSLLAVYEAFGDYDVSIIFGGDTDDLTMEVRATFADGVIEYSLESYKNNGEEPTSVSFSGEKNFVYNGKIETEIDKFVKSITAQD